MKAKNDKKYYIQNLNSHLMNILEKDYYIELGTIDLDLLNRIVKGERVNLKSFYNTNILSEGIGKITGDYINDVKYQLNYLTNLRLKNATAKFILTAGMMKIYDELGCEKYAPVVLIPFDLDLYPTSDVKEYHKKYKNNNDDKTTDEDDSDELEKRQKASINNDVLKAQIVVKDAPMLNRQLLKYVASHLGKTDADEKKLIEDYQNKPLTCAKEIDKICLELANENHTTVEPVNFFTIAFVEYPDLVIQKDYMSVEGSINEMTEEMILNNYYHQIKAISPTNMVQKYVILKASYGDRFAVDGKLATGKTRTILNIMLDQIYKGKKVLYVNQDLDNLLDLEFNLVALGLGDVFYNLSNHMIRINADMRESLENALTFDEIDKPEFSEDIFKNIFKLPNALNARIHGFKIDNVMNYLMRLKLNNPGIMEIPLETVLESHEAILIYHQLEQIEEALKQIDLYATNIWHRLQIAYNNITVEEIIERIKKLAVIHKKFTDEIKKFVTKYDLKFPSNVNDLYKLVLHIYCFASIRPLARWKKAEVRRNILCDLKEIQSLVDINYNADHYYAENINKDYQPGRMGEILYYICSQYVKVEDDLSTKDGLFINRLISYDDKLIRLSKDIDQNIMKITNISNHLASQFKINHFDEQTYLFFINLNNLLSNNIDLIILESYKKMPAVFSKHGDLILDKYPTLLNLKRDLKPYINKIETISFDNFEVAFKHRHPHKYLSFYLNKKIIQKDHFDMNELMGQVKDYYELKKGFIETLTTIFGKKEFNDDFIDNFCQFYNYVTSLNNIYKNYFDNFLDNVLKENNAIKYLQATNQQLNDFKEECYHTTSICTNLRYYNIIIDDNDVFERVEKLKKANEYILEVSHLKDEIAHIFNNKQNVEYQDIAELIQTDMKHNGVQYDLDQKDSRYKQSLGKYYLGLDTVINEIGRTIEHYDDFLEMLNNKDRIDELLKEDNFNKMLDDAKDLDLLYVQWNSAFRTFATCFKGGQPELLTASFASNTKLFKQFLDKTDQINHILLINELTEGFLEYNLKNLFDGIRSCKYGVGIAKEFIYAVFATCLKEALEKYPILNDFTEEFAQIKRYQQYEYYYIQQNLKDIKTKYATTRKKIITPSTVDFTDYNKIVSLKLKDTDAFLCDLDVFNQNLDLNLFDLVIIDDVHLSSANKYNRLSECRQVIVFGNKTFKTSVSNALMTRLGDACTINFNRRYVLANSKFNNVWSNDNQYIYSYNNKYNVVMCDSFDQFIDDIFKFFMDNIDRKIIINILIAKEETRRLIYTALVKRLIYFNQVDMMDFFNYNIRILNALRECNRYVDNVFMYYDDFKDLESSVHELVFKNFIIVHDTANIYFVKQRVEAENTKTKQTLRKVIGRINPITETDDEVNKALFEKLSEKGLEIDYGFGYFDLIIHPKTSNVPIGIKILGKENENLNLFIDDYLYYHDEYEKRGWRVKYLSMLDLYRDFDQVVKEIVNEANTEYE